MRAAVRFVALVLLLTAACVTRAAAQEERQQQGTLKVLSYNVHGLPGFVTGDDTRERLRAIGPLLDPYDLVGLQEDFIDPGHALLVQARSHPVRFRFAAKGPGAAFGSGLLLLARGRSLLRRAEHFRTFHGVVADGSDGLASKGFQVVRLALAPGVELDVYNTHLDAGGARGDQEARAAQVAHITSAMRTLSAGRAVVFLGDTNLGVRKGRRLDRETMRRWLRETGLTCACRAVRSTCCGRIDRILYRSGAGVRLTVTGWGSAPGFRDARGRPLSDHAPLRAVIRWRRGAL